MTTTTSGAPVLEARGLVKKYGNVTAINGGADFELRAGEVLAVIGDNGAGKTSLIKALAGAVVPDSGEMLMNGTPVSFKNTRDARAAGIETVYQDLAVVQALDIASNLYLGREVRRRGGLAGSLFRRLDMPRMREEASQHLADLKIGIKSVNQAVETLSGGQRQGVAVARAAAFGKGVIIMDERRPLSASESPDRSSTSSSRSATVASPWCSSATTCRTCSRSPTAFTFTGSVSAPGGSSTRRRARCPRWWRS